MITVRISHSEKQVSRLFRLGPWVAAPDTNNREGVAPVIELSKRQIGASGRSREFQLLNRVGGASR
jgi:hypothetical protein